MWCHDPDKAFDCSCNNLGCEDWCQDNSNCTLQKKDNTMFIMVKEKFDLMEEMDNSEVVIQISKDKKTFSVIKSNKFRPAEGLTYHMSDLLNILTADKG
jgi:hypothetical protein